MANIKSSLTLASSHRVIRFIMVGLTNTVINFIILNFAFYELGFGKIKSNITATCCALMFSFILNRKFVFAHRGHWFKQFIKFAVVTSVGTLIINNGFYILALSILKHHVSSSFISINGSAIIATIFSMVWNYTGYRKVVFTDKMNNEANT